MIYFEYLPLLTYEGRLRQNNKPEDLEKIQRDYTELIAGLHNAYDRIGELEATVSAIEATVRGALLGADNSQHLLRRAIARIEGEQEL